MNKNFSYIHVEKLHDWGRGTLKTRTYRQNKYSRYWGVQGCWEHDMRLIVVANADAKKLGLNQLACAETGWELKALSPQTIQKSGCMDAEFIAKKARALLGEHKIRVRDDQVKIAMLMLAVSPEYLRDGHVTGPLNDDKVEKWATHSLEYLRKKFGNGLLSVVMHLDELNPHMTAYMVPLVEKSVRIRGPRKKNAKDKPKGTVRKWCLSCKDLFTEDPWRRQRVDGKIRKVVIGKGTCSMLQDEYAEHLQAGGLEVRRGVRRSPHRRGLEHETNRERYERLSAPLADIPEDPVKLREWAETAALQAAEMRRAKVERDHYQVAAADAQKEVERLQKVIAASQRKLAVAAVIEKLFGVSPRPEEAPETVTFHLPNGQQIRVVESSNRFENLTPDIPFFSQTPRAKGRGAIDAITYLTGWSARQATEWLADTFDVHAAKSARIERIEEELVQSAGDAARTERMRHAEKIALELEGTDETKWPQVAETLTTCYAIPERYLATLHAKQWLSGNRFGHLLLAKARLAEGRDLLSVGKIIIDLAAPEVILKETGECGLVHLSETPGQSALFCATPLDGLALKSLPAGAGKSIFVLGKPADSILPDLEKIFRAFGGLVEFAQDPSKAGENLADWLCAHFPAIQLLPLHKGAASWLEVRRSSPAQTDPELR
jgi:hypothetical protein